MGIAAMHGLSSNKCASCPRQGEESYRYVSLGTSYSITINNDGYISCETPEGTTTNFGIRIVTGTGSIRPGDDLLLRFGLTNYPKFSDIVSDGDFMAVYDKIFIERAREYCDNENIKDWTNFETGEVVTDAVAYGWGCMDTVSSFNDKMLAQRDAIGAYYSAANPIWTEENKNKHPEWAAWEHSYAPPDEENSNWWEYVFSGDRTQGLSYAQLHIGKNNYFPYLPGFSYYRNWQSPPYETDLLKYSSGNDCGGFITRCASYNNTPYVLANAANERLTDQILDNWNKEITSSYRSTGSWSTGTDQNSYAFDDENINLIVPGDFLIGNNHVAIINTIVSGKDRTVNTADVKVIESTTWNSINSVRTGRNWDSMGTAAFKARRLRIKE